MSKVLPLDKLHRFNPMLDSVNIMSFVESLESYYFKTSEIFHSHVDDQLIGLLHQSTIIYSKIKEEVNPNNDTLLLVVGESWTYGDSLKPLVRAVDDIDNLPFRLCHIFSSHLANWLKCDLLQYSEPGNANFDFWYNIDSLLEFAKKQKNYSKIFIISQLTTPGRDMLYDGDRVLFEQERFNRLFNSKSKEKLPYREWAREYDEYYLDWGRHINSREDVNGLVVWKNFNKFHSKNFNGLLVVEDPIMEVGIDLTGYKPELPINNHPEFFDYCKKIPILDINTEDILKDMETLSTSYELLGKSRINDWHPNKTGHWVLAAILREKLKTLIC